jgi:hypothetical protein
MLGIDYLLKYREGGERVMNESLRRRILSRCITKNIEQISKCMYYAARQ